MTGPTRPAKGFRGLRPGMRECSWVRPERRSTGNIDRRRTDHRRQPVRTRVGERGQCTRYRRDDGALGCRNRTRTRWSLLECTTQRRSPRSPWGVLLACHVLLAWGVLPDVGRATSEVERSGWTHQPVSTLDGPGVDEVGRTPASVRAVSRPSSRPGSSPRPPRRVRLSRRPDLFSGPPIPAARPWSGRATC